MLRKPVQSITLYEALARSSYLRLNKHDERSCEFNLGVGHLRGRSLEESGLRHTRVAGRRIC